MFAFYQKIKNKPIFIYGLFLFLSLFLYWPAINTWFVSDDFHWLYIARETDLSWHIFFSNYEGGSYGGSYNPLLVLLFKFFYFFFKEQHQLYHFISITVHAGSAFLLYLLAKRIFQLGALATYRPLAKLSAILFLLWPVQREVVYWLSAWPHIWALFFYLASLLFYFRFRQENKNKYFSFSLLFFILSILTKEIAISLPLVIMLWEVYFSASRKLSKNIINNFVIAGYFVLAILFVVLRYLSIGLLFGHYSRHQLDFDLPTLASNLAGFFNEYLSASLLRTLFFKVHYYHLESLAILTMAFLALYFYYLLKKKAWFNFTLFASLLLALLPVLSLGLHRTTFGGERYLYLASIFWVMWLAYLLAVWKINIKIKVTALLLFMVFAFSVNNYKSYLWQESAALSQQIVESYQDILTDEPQTFVTVGLPDNLLGAELFRNNLAQALEFAYPQNPPQIIPLPVYTQLNPQNKNNQLLKWRQDDLGWFAQSRDGSFVVTGITSIEVEGFYFELWNYNYQNYTANIIRLLPGEEMKEKMQTGEIKILTFDRGRLKVIE